MLPLLGEQTVAEKHAFSKPGWLLLSKGNRRVSGSTWVLAWNSFRHFPALSLRPISLISPQPILWHTSVGVVGNTA